MSEVTDVTDADAAAVPKRVFVPSERELDEGLADYRFEPAPPAPPKKPFVLREKAADLRRQLSPRQIAAGHSAVPLLILGGDALFNQWDDLAFRTLLPEIRDEFDVDLAFIITLGAVMRILTLVISPVTGFMADRLNRVWMLTIGNVIQNLSSVVASRAGSVPFLSAARAMGGLGSGIAQPTSTPLLTDLYPQESRARVISFVWFMAGVGALIGPLVGGALGDLFGWRTALLVLGGLATVVSFSFLAIKDPVRGRLDRLALGADEETASREQKAVSWGEGWRTAASIATLRRIWYATPFLIAAAQMQQALLTFYYADEFGVGPTGRGAIFTIGTLAGLLCMPLAGPIADRILADRPGRFFALMAGVMLLGAGMYLVMAVSPFLWLSVLVGIPFGVLGIVMVPALLTIVSMVIPARLRAFGLSTIAPWQLLGQLLVILIVQVFQFASVRPALLMLIPLNLIGTALISTAGGGVECDMRAARAASMADEEARRARSQGGNKMVICRDVDVTYDGTQVLFNVDFDVEEGELVALLGTNGAGKSTLLRAIAGIQEASNGAIFLDGEDITHRPPHQNAAGGIVFMPGGRGVFPSLTVEENLRAAAWLYREDEEYVATRTQEVLDLFPVLRTRAKQQAGDMSGGEQQMLALAQAFLMKPRLLMIDELSLGLAPAVVEQLLDVLRRINEQGTTVVLVEQSANVALTVARRAVFMEKGEIRFDGPTEDLLRRGDLLRSVFLTGAGGGGGGAFISSSSGLHRPRTGDAAPEPVLEVANVHVRYGGHHALKGASVNVDAGQVVGIIGPNGAGKTTLFDVISGYITPSKGSVAVAGTDAAGLGPDARARLGLGRSFQNARLFPALTVRENIAVALELRLATRSVVGAAAWAPAVRKAERRAARRVEYLIDLMNLEDYATKFVSELSTGSRRMVDMACIMASEPKALLLDEPSSGLAQSEVEVLGPVVRRLAKETGCGVLVIEHDIPLVTALSDRLVAMELGAVLLEGDPQEVVEHERVVQAYLGASQAVIARSGSTLASALAAAGIAPPDSEEDPTNGH